MHCGVVLEQLSKYQAIIRIVKCDTQNFLLLEVLLKQSQKQ